jgi:hypothetical protein
MSQSVLTGALYGNSRQAKILTYPPELKEWIMNFEELDRGGGCSVIFLAGRSGARVYTGRHMPNWRIKYALELPARA